MNRVELKAIDPPPSVQDSMEKQMRAERDKRAAILTAEGFKQSQILTAEGERQSAILRAEGDAAVGGPCAPTVRRRRSNRSFDAIHAADADPKLLAYQYIQALPADRERRCQQGLGHPGRADAGDGVAVVGVRPHDPAAGRTVVAGAPRLSRSGVRPRGATP